MANYRHRQGGQRHGAQGPQHGPRFFDHKGRRFDASGNFMEEGDYEFDYFAYVFSFGTIASQDTGSDQVLVQADSDFEWQETAQYAELNGVTAPLQDNFIPQLDLQITDTGSGRSLFFAPIPVSLLAGTGRNAYCLKQPRLFSASASVNMTLFNHSASGLGPGAEDYDNVFVALIGRKIWERSK
jgi:hypothetical protein